MPQSLSPLAHHLLIRFEDSRDFDKLCAQRVVKTVQLKVIFIRLFSYADLRFAYPKYLSVVLKIDNVGNAPTRRVWLSKARATPWSWSTFKTRS